MTDNVAPAGITAEFDVSEALVGMRLDAALAGALEIPRTRASSWIRDGHVRVVQRGNELKIGKSHKLSADETVIVNAPAPRDLADIQPEKVGSSGRRRYRSYRRGGGASGDCAPAGRRH